jgi:hypothetical protein
VADASELVRDGFGTFNRDGPAAFVDYLKRVGAWDDGFEMELQADAPNGGVWKGEEGFREMIRTWMEAWEEFEIFPGEPIPVTPDRFLIPVRQRVVARGSGMELESDFFYTLEMAGGRVRRMGLFIERSLAEEHLGTAAGGS